MKSLKTSLDGIKPQTYVTTCIVCVRYEYDTNTTVYLLEFYAIYCHFAKYFTCPDVKNHIYRFKVVW